MAQTLRPFVTDLQAVGLRPLFASLCFTVSLGATSVWADPDFLVSLDFDGDGTVTVSEVALVRNQQFTQIDRDGDGKINPEEFDRSLQNARAHFRQMGQGYQEHNASPGRIDAFTFADTDADGFISRREFHRHSDRFAHSLDRDGDGIVSHADMQR